MKYENNPDERSFYHRTSATKEILAHGFRDREALYGTSGKNRTFSGVWLSDRPLDAGDCVSGDTLLKIEIPEHVVADYEWVEENKRYREWLVPAEVVNAFGPPRVCEDEEAEDERFEESNKRHDAWRRADERRDQP